MTDKMTDQGTLSMTNRFCKMIDLLNALNLNSHST